MLCRGPRFDLVAKGTLGLTDVDSCVQTFDFCLQKGNGDSGGLDLPLFGNYCCRLAAVPHCLFTPAVTGYLNLQVWYSSFQANLSCVMRANTGSSGVHIVDV